MKTIKVCIVTSPTMATDNKLNRVIDSFNKKHSLRTIQNDIETLIELCSYITITLLVNPFPYKHIDSCFGKQLRITDFRCRRSKLIQHQFT